MGFFVDFGENFIFAILSVVLHLLLTIFICLKIRLATNKSQAQFNAVFFGFTFLHMIMTLIFITIYLIISKLNKNITAIILMLQFFVFFVFEIKIILSNLRSNSKRGQKFEDA